VSALPDHPPRARRGAAVPERREHYRRDAGAFSKKYDLTEQESAAVLNVDVRSLYTMGVHSLLLRPFTLLHKVSNEDYAKALKGLV
jgi:hypothetical protein